MKHKGYSYRSIAAPLHSLLISTTAVLVGATPLHVSAGVENRQLSGPLSAPPLMGVSDFRIAPLSDVVAYRANANHVMVTEHFLVSVEGGTVSLGNLDSPGATDGEFVSTDGLGVFNADGSRFFSSVRLDQNGIEKDAIQMAAPGGVAASNLRIQSVDTAGDVLAWPGNDGVLFESIQLSIPSLLYQNEGMAGPNMMSALGLTVTDQAFSPDGQYLIMSGTGGSVTGEAVYSCKVDSDSVLLRTALTGAPVLGGGITDFKVSPDSAAVVIRGSIAVAGAAELYSRAIDGSGSLASLVSSPFAVTDYAISPDGTKVVYLRTGGSAGAELFVRPIGGGSPIKLNGTLPSVSSQVSSFEISGDSQRVIYRADQSTAGKIELYSTAMDGTGNIKLNTTVLGSVSAFKTSPDGSFVVYRADAAVVGRHELFHVPTVGGTVTRQHTALTVTRSIQSDFQVPTNHQVVFRGDVDGILGHTRLYASHAGTSTFNRLDNNSLAAGDVKEFQVTPDKGKVLYLADQNNDETVELFSAWGVPELSSFANRWGQTGSVVTSQSFTISDAETPSGQLVVTAVSDNQSVVADSGLTISGSAGTRSIAVSPVGGAVGRAVISVMVSDGVHTTTRSFEVIRYSTEYWGWLITHFGLVTITNEGLKAGTWGPNADPDSDGRINIVEYALGSFPTVATTHLNPLSIEMVDDGGTPRGHVSHVIRHNETLLSYTLQVSTDLDEWSTTEDTWVDAAPVSTVVINSNFSTRTRSLARDAAEEAKQFVLLQIGWGIDE